jgi:hypothetical protein
MEEIVNNTSDDAYAEDDELPDLVLDSVLLQQKQQQRKNSSSNSLENDCSNSSSVIDLLLSLTKDGHRRSVSTTDISHWIDATDEEIDRFDNEQVRLTWFLKLIFLLKKS